MRVSFLSVAFNPDKKESSNILMHLISSSLSKRGHEISIFTRQRGSLACEEEVDGVKVIRNKSFNMFPYRWYKDPFFFYNFFISQVFGAFLVSKKNKFDVLHIFGNNPVTLIRAVIAKKLMPNMPIVFSLSDFPTNKIHWSMLHSVDTLIINNKYSYEQFKDRGVSIPIYLLEPPLLDKFKPRNKFELKKLYSLEDKKVVLYYGHFLRSKGVYMLLDAFKQIENSHPDFHLVVAWSGFGDVNLFLSTLEKLKLKNVTLFLDKVAIEDYVSLADCVVLPYLDLSQTLRTPLCIIEAMASKTVVITSNLPQLSARFNDSEHVFFFEPNNVNSLSQTIVDVLGDATLREQVCEHAFKDIKSHKIDDYISALEKIYGNVKNL